MVTEPRIRAAQWGLQWGYYSSSGEDCTFLGTVLLLYLCTHLCVQKKKRLHDVLQVCLLQPLLMKFPHEWPLSREMGLVILQNCMESNHLGLSWWGGVNISNGREGNLQSDLCHRLWPASKTWRLCGNSFLVMPMRNDPVHSLVELEDEKFQGGDQLPKGSTIKCVNLLLASDRYKVERVRNNEFII